MNYRLRNLDLGKIVLFISHFFQNVELLELLSNSTNNNLSYKMRLDQKDCVLKIYSHGNKRKILQSIQLQNFLYARGFPCQSIITPANNLLLEDEGRYYSLFEFVHGESMPVRAITADYAFQILDVLKLFYKLTKNYSGDIDKKNPRVPPFENGLYNAKFEEMLERYKSILRKIFPRKD